MMNRTLALTLALVGCRSVAQPGSQTIPETHRDPIRAERTDAGPPRVAKVDDAGPPAPEVPPRWGKLPETSGELFSVVDGSCHGLNVYPLENATLISYSTYDKVTLARVTPEGTLEKLPPAMPDKGKQPWVRHVNEIVGRWPDAVWLAYDDGGRCVQRDSVMRLAGNAWKPAFDLGDFDSVVRVQPYKDGAIGFHSCMSNGCGGNDENPPGCANGTMWSDALKTTPPITPAGGGFHMEDFHAFPTGEIVAFGTTCPWGGKDPCTSSQVRIWSPGTKIVSATLARTDGTLDRMLARSPTETIITHGSALYVFDGQKLDKRATLPFEVTGLYDRGEEGIWARSKDKLFALAAGGAATDITPPPGKGTLSVFANKHGAWATRGDAVYRREGSDWKKVELPRPPFSSTTAYLTPASVHIRAPDEVWVVATYHEQQPAWSEVETRTTILSTKRPKQTLRCRLDPIGTDTMLGGLLAWPTPVSDACKTPFVVLAPVSPSSPKTNDYPKTRSVLKKHVAQITGAALVEIRSDDITWIGVRASTSSDAKQIAETYSKSYPMAHTEAVCADPEIVRTIPIEPK